MSPDAFQNSMDQGLKSIFHFLTFGISFLAVILYLFHNSVFENCVWEADTLSFVFIGLQTEKKTVLDLLHSKNYRDID
jgi:hypothetical protein